MCNINRPAIFTDVFKYKKWILNHQPKVSNLIINPYTSTSSYNETPRSSNKMLFNQCLVKITKKWVLCEGDKPIRVSWNYGEINNYGIVQDDGKFVIYTSEKN